MHRMGFSYDWSLEVTTCEPEYYRWNQWFFLKMLERGLAYRKKALVNWCPECGTVLANEQVVDGCCWRHETTPVEQRALEQWFWKITDYADELLRDIDEKLEGGWPERVLSMQRNWIGRSEGSEIDFTLEGSGETIRVFTTRVDTIYGATCVILAPEHPLAQKLLDDAGRARAKQMIDARAQQGSGRYREGRPLHRRITRSIRTAARRCRSGSAIRADGLRHRRDHGRARARRARFRILHDVTDSDSSGDSAGGRRAGRASESCRSPTTAWSRIPASIPACPARKRAAQMNERAEREGFGKAAITFRIKDWGISRQRYWGTPIPVIHCPKCGVVPVPERICRWCCRYDVKITGKGRSPLAEVPSS